MSERPRPSWPVVVLALLCAGAIVAAVLVVGPASGSEPSATRTATVAQGIVQSTVSGSGNLQPASQLNLGFKTAGTVAHIFVSQGEQVANGQLLAELDPQSAEVTLEQAKATLQAAEANLTKEEETRGETSTGQSGGSGNAGGSGSGGASASTSAGAGADNATTAAYVRDEAAAQAASADGRQQPSTGKRRRTPTTTSTAPASSAPTSTTPASSAPPSASAPAAREGEANQARSSSSSSSGTTVSSATREANLASARAAVKSDKLSVQSAGQAVQDTKLYAPEAGTIVSLSGQAGEVVSASGTTRASSASSSSSGSGASGASGAGSSAARASAGSQGAAGSSSNGSAGASSSSSSAFAVLSDLTSMQLVVPLSESEIGNVKPGQIATVTVEALEGRKLAAHVSSVAILSTSNSGVVSYDVTFQLDQMDASLKPGMSASAEVVVKQAEGLNVPTSAISAGAVTVLRNGKQVRQRVVTGLAGNSSTIILSGLTAGETVVLPTAASGASSTSSLGRGGGRLGGLPGAGGLGGAGARPGAGGLGGGGALFFRGGGG